MDIFFNFQNRQKYLDTLTYNRERNKKGMVLILNKKLSSILATGALMVTVSPALGTFVQVGDNIVHAEAFKAGSTGSRTLKHL